MDLKLLVGWNGLAFAAFAVLLVVSFYRRRRNRREHAARFIARSVAACLLMISFVTRPSIGRVTAFVAFAIFAVIIECQAASDRRKDAEQR